MDRRVFTIQLRLEDEELIETILDAITGYVEAGLPIKVRQAYVTSFSDSTKLASKIISSKPQMDEWRAETKQLISTIRKAPIR